MMASPGGDGVASDREIQRLMAEVARLQEGERRAWTAATRAAWNAEITSGLVREARMHLVL